MVVEGMSKFNLCLKTISRSSRNCGGKSHCVFRLVFKILITFKAERLNSNLSGEGQEAALYCIVHGETQPEVNLCLMTGWTF